jgi:DNA-binding XRE family transcriptional regulator
MYTIEVIEEAREKLGWTKGRMCLELGITSQCYWHWENSKGSPIKEIYVKYISLVLKQRNLGGFREQIKAKGNNDY